MQDQDVKISFMDIADIDEVTAIENASFPHPWSRNMFLQELQLEMSRSIVAKITRNSAAEIAGYMIYWLVSNEVHLQKIAAKPDFRRSGISSMLMKAMIRRSLESNGASCLLEVRRSNEPAVKLYEKFGFSVQGIRPKYYSETGEDAVIMGADLKESMKLIQHER
jgi:[ribosomal protein S18]-alanine N-acetyltransferase